MLRHALERNTRRHGALAVVIQLTNALWVFFCAKGDFHSEVADLSFTSQPCIPRSLTEEVICTLAPQYIRFPQEDELRQIKEEFFRQSGMPGVIVDGSLFPIKAPAGPDEVAFVSHKGFHAINVPL